jgi:hypothetical protein
MISLDIQNLFYELLEKYRSSEETSIWNYARNPQKEMEELGKAVAAYDKRITDLLALLPDAEDKEHQ